MGNILIRVSTSKTLGSGHITRCTRLAKKLAEYGHDILFATNEEGIDYLSKNTNFRHIIKITGNDDETLDFKNVEAKKWLGMKECEDAERCIYGLSTRKVKRLEWIIVDHYGIGEEWEKSMTAKYVGSKVLIMDDLADRRHYGNILVDQNYWIEDKNKVYKELVNEGCKLLIGTKYAIINKVKEDENSDNKSKGAKRVMVYFGGSDTKGTDICMKLAKKKRFQNIIFDIVLGQNIDEEEAQKALETDEKNINIFRNLKDLDEVMMRADLAIGASGSTNWERISIGLPAIVATTSDDQIEIAKNLGKSRLIYYLGSLSDIAEEDIEKALTEYCLGNIEFKVDKYLCDGKGIQRIIDHMRVKKV